MVSSLLQNQPSVIAFFLSLLSSRKVEQVARLSVFDIDERITQSFECISSTSRLCCMTLSKTDEYLDIFKVSGVGWRVFLQWLCQWNQGIVKKYVQWHVQNVCQPHTWCNIGAVNFDGSTLWLCAAVYLLHQRKVPLLSYAAREGKYDDRVLQRSCFDALEPRK